jgi:hypothetical protein
VRVPFFDPIAPTESQILSNATWGGGGGYLVPANVTADQAEDCHSGSPTAWSVRWYCQ